MKKRPLGKTGLNVTEVSLGGLFVSSWGATYDEAERAVHRALDLGINYIDTAPGYGNSEEVLGKILGKTSSELIVSTKLGGRPLPFNPRDKAALRSSLEESLRLLHRDYVDILMIHEPDRPGQYDWWSEPADYSGPVIELLDELKAEGKIRFTGIGGTTAYEMANVVSSGRFDAVLTAFQYSLLYREAAVATLPAAKRLGIGTIIGSPLQQGNVARRYDAELAGGARWISPARKQQLLTLYRYLDEIDMPIAEAGLRFVIGNPDISCLLTGVRSVAELENSINAVAKGSLPGDVATRLDEIAAMVPFRPADEPPGLPFGNPLWAPGSMH